MTKNLDFVCKIWPYLQDLPMKPKKHSVLNTTLPKNQVLVGFLLKITLLKAKFTHSTPADRLRTNVHRCTCSSWSIALYRTKPVPDYSEKHWLYKYKLLGKLEAHFHELKYKKHLKIYNFKTKKCEFLLCCMRYLAWKGL